MPLIRKIRPPNSRSVFVVWKDSSCVAVMTKGYLGHSTNTVKHHVKDPSGFHQVTDVPIPTAIASYNKFMGGVDKSDQFISHKGYRVLHKTVRYLKTINVLPSHRDHSDKYLHS
jgi:hypothetical protein